MGKLYLGLLHYPCYNRRGEIVATALTGLDVPDIARSCRTYEVATYYVITPLPSQQAIAQRIIDYWMQEERDQAHRRAALQRIKVVATLEASLADVLAIEGVRPQIVGTSARERPALYPVTYEQLRGQLRTDPTPVYLLFGTGWGIAAEVLERIDRMLPPICGPDNYNHLSVRAAAAIILDRLRGVGSIYRVIDSSEPQRRSDLP
jgi:hypothetical protein